MKNNKKILFTIISVLTMLVVTLMPIISVAKTTKKYTIKLIQTRSDGNSYSINDGNYTNGSTADSDAHKIWNLVHVTDSSSGTYEDANIYCMCAVRDGFTYDSTSSYTNPYAYDTQYDLKADKDELISEVFNDNVKGSTVEEKYPYILGLCDIMYNPYDSNEEGYKKELLEAAGLKENDLTDGAISAIQQAALWYWTNQKKSNGNDSTYKKIYTETKESGDAEWFWVKEKNGSKFVQADEATRKKVAKLYIYLIDTARNIGENVYKDSDDATAVTPPVVITSQGAKLENSKYGPLKITKKNKLTYKLNISVVDEGETGNTNIAYTLVDADGKAISDINSYTGNVYINFTNNDFNTAKIKITANWQVANANVHTKSTARETVQPAVRFTKANKSKAYSFSVENDKTFDLALRKYITALNGKPLTGNYVRDLNNIDTTKLASNDDTTAIYKHTKNPVKVKTNDVVTYTIKLYNEGEQAGVVESIIDQLPTGIVPKVTTGTITSTKGIAYNINYNESENKLTFGITSANTLPKEKQIAAFNGQTLDFDQISFDCIVKAEASTEEDKIFTNIAYIAGEYNVETEKHVTAVGDDRDSEPSTRPFIDDKNGNPTIAPTKDNMEDYHGEGKEYLADSNYFYEGRQDDDDFEKVLLEKEEVVPEGDYSINIVKVDSKDNSKLSGAIFTVNGSDKTATDNNGTTIVENKKEIQKENDTIVYEITEKTAPNGYSKFDGKIKLTVVTKKQDDKYSLDVSKTSMTVYDASGDEITSNIPVTINKTENSITITVEDAKLDGTYKIELVKEDTNGENLSDPATFEVTNKQTGKTETKTTQNSKLDITNGTVQITPENVNTQDVYVIKETIPPDEYCKFDGIITITVKKTESNGNYVVDGKPTYVVTDTDGNDITSKTGDTVSVEVRNGNIYVYVKNYQFDLALRKFIAQVNDTELKTTDGKSYLREPEVDTSKLNTIDSDGNKITTAIYNHPKTPVEVRKGDTVIYILRVYNEGDMDGYATEITDHLPEYLEFVKGDYNDKYKWELLEDGRTVKTTYLENQLIEKATKNSDGKLVLSYKDVPIMCKVKDTAKTKESITNIADITNYTDKDRRDNIKDRDSDPSNVKLPSDNELPGYKENENGRYIPGQEDDDDFEKLVIYEFDLALRKWVTQAIVIENGEETVTNTGHDAWDEPEEVVKVELNRKKLSDITVKFRYSIRVYNQGDIEGYAKEITDYVPQGLKFVAEDNKGWTDEGNNIISTRLLEDTLLKPGEYADVEVVLTWINGQDNIGLKTNTAEISEDFNEKGVPDKDSTPDNQVPGEDDIDDAPVILSIETGREVVYIGLGFVILVTLGAGVYLIKKYVL